MQLLLRTIDISDRYVYTYVGFVQLSMFYMSLVCIMYNFTRCASCYRNLINIVKIC